MNPDDTNLNATPLSAQESGSDMSIPSEEQSVKLWRRRIKQAKEFFDLDYKRMKDNMAFAAGLQWQGQESINDKEERYIANYITSHINSKVASLYAKDPKAEAVIRKRLIYTTWDGTVEQEWQATAAAQQGAMMGIANPQAMAILQDIQQGKQWESLLKKVKDTLEILYEYQCDSQSPTFKKQMKQLVRRVVTTGVGYVRLNFVRSFDHVLSSALTDDSLAFRMKQVKAIMAGIQDDTILEDDPRIEQLRMLLESVQSSVQSGDTTDVQERLEFDFPSSTSIIVDPKCKALKGFIGAEWVAQQYIMPLSTANAYFELSGDEAVKVGGDFVQYDDAGCELPRPSSEEAPNDVQKSPMGCFWEVFDYTTKEHFFICDGWKWFVQEPRPVEPEVDGFWPIVALTFNDVEVEPGQKVHIYPPSDVQLLKPMQKERNRSRQELREHRKINRPLFWTMTGWLTPADRDKLSNHESGELLELQGVPPNGDVSNAIGHWAGNPIDQNMYSTQPLDEDSRIAVGSNQVQQQANISHTAATPAMIQEQSRMSGVSSNVDDLDDCLSDLARMGGQVMLREFSPQTVQRICGQGSVWPDQNRQDFLNSIYLGIVAASSGRPNKAVDISNAQQLVPMLLQAGANPWGVIEYLVRVSDANLDVADFAPQAPSMMPMQGNKPPTQAPHPGVTGQQSNAQPMPAGLQQGGAN